MTWRTNLRERVEDAWKQTDMDLYLFEDQHPEHAELVQHVRIQQGLIWGWADNILTPRNEREKA